MKALIDFIPILLFFVAYKTFNLMVATSVAIVASLIQTLWARYTIGRFQAIHVTSFFSILILGGATLLLKDELFIKWKPTAVYWLLSLLLMFSQYFSKKPLLQRLSEKTIALPSKIWRQLNMSWAIFFLLMGLTNLYVLYNFDTDSWVNFKLFGTLGLTTIFVIGQAIYMTKHSSMENRNH